MSKRRKPVIPDFARKPKPTSFRPDASAPAPAPTPVVSVNVKPHATSSKSGRRGS